MTRSTSWGSKAGLVGLVALASGRATAQEPSPGVFFVELDGVELTAGELDDARTNTTQIAELAGVFAPYAPPGSEEARDAVVQATRAKFAAYDVRVSDVRPASGDYVMSVVSPTNPLGGGGPGGVLGVAPLDCGDTDTFNNVTFAFHGADDGFTVSATATTIAQEIAHSIGLEHVDDPRDVMFPHNVGGDPEFLDECVGVTPDATGAVYCGDQHAAHCGAGGGQNGHAELLARFGPAQPVAEGPVVQIASPSDGETLSASGEIEIRVEVLGDEVSGVRLFVDGAVVGTDDAEPFGWRLVDPSAGAYEVYAEADDLAGNVGVSEVITLFVVGGDGTPALPATFGHDDERDPPSGFGCRIPVAPSSSWTWLGLLGLARRREHGA